MRNRPIPEATVARLPIYLRSLSRSRGDSGPARRFRPRNSPDLAGVNAAKVRKDLSYLGSYGTRGVGYDVEYLLYQITRELGLTQDWPAAIVGVGNLGRALASYKGFSERGFRIAALFDVDDNVVGNEGRGPQGPPPRRSQGGGHRRGHLHRDHRDTAACRSGGRRAISSTPASSRS